MARVAALMAEWALERGESPSEVRRWKAAGFLHDALRDADHDALRATVGPPFKELPGKILHGPGAAARLRAAGVSDEEILHAVAYHTLGSGDFGIVGMALYAADFLEPGRKKENAWREGLRSRGGRELEAVVKEILFARMRYQVERGRPLHPETVAFWNRMSEGQDWASASEL
jgi:2-amino-4-hydroxy-6-hydroxymethyldihydropteridine diphosphokinase